MTLTNESTTRITTNEETALDGLFQESNYGSLKIRRLISEFLDVANEAKSIVHSADEIQKSLLLLIYILNRLKSSLKQVHHMVLSRSRTLYKAETAVHAMVR